MAKLTIKNVGAIKSIEFDVNRINVFIGPQSSGKSTISKILCHCQWVEKTCFLNSKELDTYQEPGIFYDSLIEYHKMDGYFNNNSSLKYVGDYMTITYTHSTQEISIKVKEKTRYLYPKISYIPSKRNFVASVPNWSKYNESSNLNLLYFGYDWMDAKKAIDKLDISKFLNRKVIYKNLNDQDYIFDDDSKIRLLNASSGILSLLPLYQTILYMTTVIYDETRVLSSSKQFAKNDIMLNLQIVQNAIREEKLENVIQKYEKEVDELITVFNSIDSYHVHPISKLEDLSKDKLLDNILDALIDIEGLFDYHYTQLFIEEPEQNLFPETQQQFVYWLLSTLLNEKKDHAAVVTTHSPYILFALNNCMMGGLVEKNIPEDIRKSFISYSGWIEPKLVSIYEICNGELKYLQDEDGIIEDNYFNRAYKNISKEYLSLLNYYEENEE